MNCIAIITARGGSKRIPRKNIKTFAGKPMLCYAVEAAQKANVFDEIMVSTDDEEIAHVARICGASVPFMRSAETSNDFAITYDVLVEVLNEYKKRGKEFDSLCCIYPCVPFLKAESLKSAFEMLQKNTANAITPICKYSVPIEWAMKMENGILCADNIEAQKIRSQDLEPKYFDVGMFYFYKTNVFLSQRTTLFPMTLGYIVDENECQDIDTENDWKIAEIKYKILHENDGAGI